MLTKAPRVIILLVLLVPMVIVHMFWPDAKLCWWYKDQWGKFFDEGTKGTKP